MARRMGHIRSFAFCGRIMDGDDAIDSTPSKPNSVGCCFFRESRDASDL